LVLLQAITGAVVSTTVTFCGNGASCSQKVTVVDTTAPVIACSNTNKTVQLGLTWTFDAPTATDNSGNAIITIVSTVTNTAGHCGCSFDTTRIWKATDACGNSAQCSQTVTVVDATAPIISCNTNKAVELGAAWTFDAPTATDSCGSATITVVSTLTNAGCGNSFSAKRTWQATDPCGNSAQCSQTVTVIDSTAPVVTIISPTNGTQFVTPASFSVLVDAFDLGGIVKVEFFSGTTRIAETTNAAPYFVILTNVTAGNYTFTAKATDGCGLISTSAPVTVSVLSAPPMSIGPVQYDPQTDIFKQKVRFTNPTYSSFDAVRVYVSNLTNSPAITVCNASGQTNGIPYVQTQGPVMPGSFVDLIIEYCSPLRVTPNPVLQAQLVPPSTTASFVGVQQHINRGLMLANHTFLVEFLSASDRIYAIQYSSDLVNWKSALPAITGTGTWIQWIDNGQPKTESSPDSVDHRFYRLIELP